MPVKLFILGLPGSGKSAVARFILKYVSRQQVDEQNDQCWSAIRCNDYAILLDMFHQDIAGKRFKPTSPSGFDVRDLKVFDEALQTLEQEVNMYIDSLKPEEKKLVLIEFSRNDYEHAFQQFNKSFLMDAYFLYLDVDIEICKRRIRERIAHPSTEDDFYVSEYIFRAYYNKDNGQSISYILERSFGIDKQRVAVIDNNGSLKASTVQINRFVDTTIELEAYRLRQTDPIQIIPSYVSDNELAK